MARSNKPLLWLPFAAGGTLAAFVLPAVMAVTLLAALGLLPEAALAFERVQVFVSHFAGKLILLAGLGLPLWHAAHRLRMTLQDLGVRSHHSRKVTAASCYLVAMLTTLAMLYALWPA